MKKSLFLCLTFSIILFSLSTSTVNAQGVGINSSGNPADPSAILDASANNKGMLVPRVSLLSTTDTTTIPSPATSLLVYNTNASITGGSGTGFYFWNGTQWKAVGGAATTPCSVAPSAPTTISGDINVCTNGIGTYFVPSIPDATSYTWTYSGTGATISGTRNDVVLSFSSSATSGNLTVTATNACGTSSSSPALSILVNATPNSSFTASSSPPIVGQSVTFNPTSTDNQLFYWTFPGPIYSSTISPSFGAWTLAGTYNVALSVMLNGCNSTSVVSFTTNSQIFYYTGAQQTFTVPAGVTSVILDCYGAQGGQSTGGRAKGTLAVTPGQTLYVYVGNTGGWNGGGNSTYYRGGGASDVRVGGTALTDRVIVAGGGGGNGLFNNQYWTDGGSGGGSTGGTGTTNNGQGGGTGGSQSAGGAAGTGTVNGAPGSFGQGGAGTGYAGGGGGGFYGGGSGGTNNSTISSGGGGGGSNYLSPSLTLTTNSQGVWTGGNGQVIITW